MDAMNMFLPARFGANRFEFPATAGERMPAADRFLLVRLRNALAGRRAPPFEHLSDHLRRDIGLPPLDPAAPGRCRR